MELRHYRHVLALVEHANFRRASEALGISQAFGPHQPVVDFRGSASTLEVHRQRTVG